MPLNLHFSTAPSAFDTFSVDVRQAPIPLPLPPKMTNQMFQGTTGDDVFIGHGAADTFAMEDGGDDTAKGRGGDDVFSFGAALTKADRINGGDGYDTLKLDGDYTAAQQVRFAGGTMQNVEQVDLAAGHDYKLRFVQQNGIDDHLVTVSGIALGKHDAAKIDASHFDAHQNVALIGGAGDDVLTGGAAGDILTGNGGRDFLSGGGGADSFRYVSISDSSGWRDSRGLQYDSIVLFNVAEDVFLLPHGIDVTNVKLPAHGTASAASLENDLNQGVYPAGGTEFDRLEPDTALLFQAIAGTLGGHTFLMVDANGFIGYQAGLDFLFDVTNISANPTPGNFITED